MSPEARRAEFEALGQARVAALIEARRGSQGDSEWVLDAREWIESLKLSDAARAAAAAQAALAATSSQARTAKIACLIAMIAATIATADMIIAIVKVCS